jgi:transposase InsO family protein
MGQYFPVDMLCQMLGVARSSYYDYLRQKNQKAQGHKREKPGPRVQLDDKQLLAAIVEVMTASPFVTEGVKKVHARLRRKGTKASRNRVNLIMREHSLLSPQRHEQGEEKKHDGTIIPDSINQIWGTDGTLFGTITGDLLWLFAVIDHFSDEVLGWHIVEVGQGDRFAALEPIKQGVRRIRGCVGKDIGNGIAIRHDWGPQYIAHDFKEELKFLGLKNSPALVHEPQTNGVIERFFKTLKWECLWVENILDVEHARDVVGRWMETYNTQWLIERHGHQTPREVRQACQETQAEVA